jgi:uncharacterized integral membrane protein (TIGR00698 family)
VRLPGLGLAAAIALFAMALARVGWFSAHGLSALTLSIVLGMVVGNTLYPRLASRCGPGVGLAKQYLLRLGIILYGFRLTFQDIGKIGAAGVLIDAIIVCSTFAIAYFAGTRLFGIDRKTAMLIGAGSSICGAAAVMAAEPVVRGRAEQVTVAVATVVVFGTVGIFLYPALFNLNARIGLMALSPTAYGLYVGSTIHEVAQVVAAGNAISEAAANTAVIVKMTRVMMLAPFLIALSALLARGDGRAERSHQGSTRQGHPVVIPWFAVAFVAVAGFNSFALLPAPVVGGIIETDTLLLAMAMSALGLSTHLSAIRQAGVKPLGLAALLFVWLVGGGAVVNLLVAAALR